MPKKNWYFSRVHRYVDLSNIFAGFGTLLIEGDSLIHYLSKVNSKASRIDINKFIFKKLKEAGFDKITIVFFHSHSKWTQLDDKNKISLKNTLDELTSDLKNHIRIFEDWTTKTWSEYLNQEHISVFLVSDSEIYSKNEIQFDLIYHLSNQNNLQVALIDNLKVINFKVNTFLLLINREYHNLDVEFFDTLNNDKMIQSNERNHEIETTFEMIQLENERLDKLLELNNNQIKDSKTKPINLSSEIKWEIKLHYKKQENFKTKRNINKDKQKYSRYMEKYAKSLDASKHLHHKIIANVDFNNQVIPDKLSSKAKQIIQTNEAQKLIEQEKKEINFIESLIIKCYNDIDESFKLVDTTKYTQQALYNLLLLRIKWLKNEPITFENKKLNLFLFIKEAFESYSNKLTQTNAIHMLECLKNHDFHNSCEYLKNLLIKSRKDLKSLDKNIETNIDSFDHDVLFQLKYCGDKINRTLNSKDDVRVKFKPDEWQRELLDIVDRNESALICCPTSSGKTFISYYVMEKALRHSHDDMVIFLAPIKALANQAAAEIYARFGTKVYPRGYEKTIYAMNMPDYQIHEPLNCQILITVPPTFENMLCENEKDFISKIKYVIIDEIQTINDPELGASIEKIIHMINCPVLFISATIGNLDPFHNWLNEIQKSKGIKLNKILHTERFCDLKKYVFSPINYKKIVPIHELFGYSEKHLKNDELSEEFHLLPSEIVDILDTLEKIAINSDQKSLIESIQPKKFFKNVILNKQEVKEYELFIMKKLKMWCQQGEFTLDQFKEFFRLINGECNETFKKLNEVYGSNLMSRNWSQNHIFDLVKNLYENKMLPAIVFLKSCDECDKLAQKLINHLEMLENNQKNQKDEKKAQKVASKVDKLRKNLRERKHSSGDVLDRDEYEILEELKMTTPLINDKYTFFDFKYKMTEKEIDEEIELHKHREIPGYLFDGWKRGIGVHHANYHTKFRSSVECLFRKRHLQIVFATETLSLGVNMPCKTVVMPVDSIYFNSIYYRHMVGRAGRRGFDTIGNIVYYGVPEKRVKNFISSKIANIKGLHILDLNLLVQVSALQCYQSNAFDFFESFLNNSIVKLTSSDYYSDKCKYYAQIKIQYLIRKNFINAKFNPLKNSHAVILLRNELIDTFMLLNYLISESFDSMITPNSKDKEEVANRICLVLCHFSSVIYILPSHEPMIKSLNLNILLPKIDQLNEFVLNEKQNFKMFLNQFNLTVEELEINENGFSDFSSIFFPKNSYLYEFYLNGNLEKVIDINDVSENDLWYGLREIRHLAIALKSIFSNKISLINEAFDFFSNKINQRFFQINN